VARFLSLDPLAAKFPKRSTYNYVLGNPVMFVDSDGRGVKPGENWKGSDYERVYNKLRKESNTYSESLKYFEKEGAKGYIFHNIGEFGRRTGYTNLDDRKGQENVHNDNPSKKWKLDIETHFVASYTKMINGERKSLNDCIRVTNPTLFL
jgi:hypothetical protein